MPTDPRVDQYIAKAPEFAKPILEQLRQTIHEGCPKAIEDVKWSRPVFLYRKKILFGTAVFKAHCSFFVFQRDVNELLEQGRETGTGLAGCLGRIVQLSDLPPKRALLRYVKEAVRLVDESLANPAPKKRTAPPKPEAEVPPDLAAALAKNKSASKAFLAFSPSHRREYIEWITEAKREETRQRRITTALEWLAEGKSRNWKYSDC